MTEYAEVVAAVCAIVCVFSAALIHHWTGVHIKKMERLREFLEEQLK